MGRKESFVEISLRLGSARTRAGENGKVMYKECVKVLGMGMAVTKVIRMIKTEQSVESGH